MGTVFVYSVIVTSVDFNFEERMNYNELKLWRSKTDLIGSAMLIASFAHSKQNRKWGGEPYIVHPVRVAKMVMEDSSLDERHFAVALLHDSIEDNEEHREMIKEDILSMCGTYVYNTVWELTNPSAFVDVNTPRVQKKDMDFAKLKGVSLEAKKIKMMDRLDNLYDALAPGNFMKKYLPESMELAEICRVADEGLYSKIANRVIELQGE